MNFPLRWPGMVGAVGKMLPQSQAVHTFIQWKRKQLSLSGPRIKYPSRRSILFHTNDIAESAQPLYNVYIVEELIQLTIELDKEIIANSH